MKKDIGSGKMTLGEWLEFWFETYKAPVLKPYSVRNIEQVLRLHTPAWLKAKPLAAVTVFDADKALIELPLGRTRVYARQVWHSAFVKACKLGLIEKNVLALTDGVKYRKRKSSALSLREQRDFLKAVEGSSLEWLMKFYLLTGVRRTEALTLRWEDIDEEEGLILIRGTKTEESYRYIPLSAETNAVLARQREQGAKGGSKRPAPDDGRVFPYSPCYVSQAFKQFCPSHHLHDLRHTYITRCAECGISVKVCQQFVGHVTADMTLNVYMHVFDDYKRREAAKFTLFPEGFGLVGQSGNAPSSSLT